MGLFNSIRMGSSAAGDYEVERSLRFVKTDYSRLERTPSSTGNQKVWTFSAWFKRTKLADSEYFISSYGNNDGIAALYFDSSDRINTYYDTSGSNPYGAVNERKYRDCNAWMHIVWQVDAENTTQKIWINGVEETLDSSLNPPNFAYTMNQSGQLNTIGNGAWYPSGTGANMYLAEIHFSDGTKYTPSDFAETNALTGQWIPKASPAITYGTNGYYLNFSDNSNTTAATLGKDSSGNSNNWTPTNFVTGDSVKDSPTNNFATLRTHSTPEASGVALTEGNLKYTTGSTGGAGTLNRIAISTFLPTSGKWYAEVIPTSGAGNQCAGIVPYTVEESPTTDRPRYNIVNFNNGDILQNLSGSGGTLSNHGDSVSTNDVLCIYMDMDAKTVYYGKNGQWADGSGNWDQSTPTSGLSLGTSFFNYKTGGHEGFAIAIMSVTGGASITCIANFGQDSTFAGTLSAGGNADANGIGDFKYAVPTGAKALCTANLPDPTIALPNQHFNTVLYTGNNNTSQNITGVGFQPDLVWVKNRDNVERHHLVDAVRGDNKVLFSNESDTERTGSHGNGHTQLNLASDGFNLVSNGTNDELNFGTRTYVAWNWNAGGSTVTNNDGATTSQVRANTTAGFSIVTYTGTGDTSETYGHGLGVKPDCIIVKSRNVAGQDWVVYHKDLNGGSSPAERVLKLNSYVAELDLGDIWYDTEPTSSIFTVGDEAMVNYNSSSTYVAYCFSGVEGFSKFGSYVGNGNSNGSFIFTGFKPAFFLVKQIGDISWYMYDNKRDTINPVDNELNPHNNQAEASGHDLDFLSNGVKMRTSDSSLNYNNYTYIYLAFAESPFKYSRAR